ncbi:MAG: adenosylmethionine decarboxylase [Candidatus Sericytochromatia bacterium]|nr:adenosylmethionine decarboxylase [Candidatus Sericytochromatia bacterium]
MSAPDATAGPARRPGPPSYLGRQVLAELYDCDAGMLADRDAVAAAMLAAARACGATIVESVFHHFAPLGVSGVVVIAESHLTIHTWPEHRYAAVDVFTCGVTIEPGEAVDALARTLAAGHLSLTEVNRGAVRHLRGSG